NARLFQQIDAARRQLQALSRRLVDIQEEERRYIARELHDEAGQELTSLLVGLGLLGRELADRPSLLARVQELKEMTDGIMANLHRLSVRLRPAVLDRLGLVPALRQHVETFLEENGLTGEFATVGLDNVKLSPEVEITVYRVVQEALTNIARHAQASHVDVLLEKRDSDGGEPRVLAIIEDDGVGFDPVEAAQRGRLGVFGMEERAQVLGGSFQVESMPGAGTTVFVEIPI
ncbi:MAG TPA: sensor histidine kinase, partial [Anaerolineae bacterium]